MKRTREVHPNDEYLATAILSWRLRARSGKAAMREAWSCVVTWDETHEPSPPGWHKPIVSVRRIPRTGYGQPPQRLVK